MTPERALQPDTENSGAYTSVAELGVQKVLQAASEPDRRPACLALLQTLPASAEIARSMPGAALLEKTRACACSR
eukprot:66673-Rhodomonas_salina.15